MAGADGFIGVKFGEDLVWQLDRACRVHRVTVSDYVREAVSRRLATEKFGKRKEVDGMFMVHQTGQAPIDLDKVQLRGRPIRSWGRDELEAELLRIGIDVPQGAGRDGMAIAYHRWLKSVTDGNPPEAA
jgi:hypothetical protein